MDTITYQHMTRRTAVYPDARKTGGLVYVTLGLAGEAGEIANKVKKILRDDDGVITNEKRAELADELGDVLWYASQLATELGTSLGYVMETNLRKLQDRQVRGTLGGAGDGR